MTLTSKDVSIIRKGDANGDGMIIKFCTNRDVTITSIAVPQNLPSGTGPTWVYIFENEGLTLIDSGSDGSYPNLAKGIRESGFEIKDIERVAITHGHGDHDGSVGELLSESGAELWAHDIYFHLLPYDPWDLQRIPSSAIQKEMQKIISTDAETIPAQSSQRITQYTDDHTRYVNKRKNYPQGKGLIDGYSLGNLNFMHTPGHSPDEICIQLDDVIFTGDHVLPEITPHPTTKIKYSSAVRDNLPNHYHNESDFYGLGMYLKSLQRISDTNHEITVLPAHRLYNRNKLNLLTVSRASEIVEHHLTRLDRILNRIGTEPKYLEEITRGIFSKRKLIGGNLYMALSEVVSHIELLEDLGDLHVGSDCSLRWLGTRNYREFLSGANV